MLYKSSTNNRLFQVSYTHVATVVTWINELTIITLPFLLLLTVPVAVGDSVILAVNVVVLLIIVELPIVVVVDIIMSDVDVKNVRWCHTISHSN